MCNALAELQRKGIPISEEEELGAKIAILLHDMGHGRFSHVLENVLIRDVGHADISILIMEALNTCFKVHLNTAIQIFKNVHPKRHLHKMQSWQLDTARMDLRTRVRSFNRF